MIGLTLVVAGDSFFLTLFVVIVFHQMFEGLALGTRIAALGKPCLTTPATHGHGHGHSHSHGGVGGPKPAEKASTDASTELNPPQDEGHSTHTAGSSATALSGAAATAHVSMRKKIALAAAFAIVTPLGMAIGIGALHNFNGNDPSTVIAIGTLDALSAGILVWVGVVEMWAHDWMLGGELTSASPVRTALGLAALVAGMAIMSLLGKWA